MKNGENEWRTPDIIMRTQVLAGTDLNFQLHLGVNKGAMMTGEFEQSYHTIDSAANYFETESLLIALLIHKFL